jgi:FlgD Ig-like domain
MRFLRRVLISRAVPARAHSFLASAAFATALLCMAASARAGGGVGSAWVIAHTPYTVTIQWSAGEDYYYCDYSIESQNHEVRVCYKPDGAKKSPCGENGDSKDFAINSSRTITADGLTPGTTYHFEVMVLSHKKNGGGKCKYRQLGAFTETTPVVPAPFVPIDNVSIIGTGENSLVATVTTNHAADFDFIRIAYMQIPTQYSVQYVAHTVPGPAIDWGYNNVQRGWIDKLSASSLTFGIDSLQACHGYEVVAYGFRWAFPSNGTLLGEARNRTGINCQLDRFEGPLIADYGRVLEAYADAVHQFYCGDFGGCDTLSIFNHVAALHPELYDDQAAMIADGEWVTDEYETIAYLEDGHRDIFDAWQTELADAGMDMVQFTERNYRAVYASIIAETTGKPSVISPRPIPTTSSYPNPFNPETTIGFTTTDRGPVSVAIYDVSGGLVRTLVHETLSSGSHTAVWDGRDDRGQRVPSGMYFYRFVAGSFSETRKILLLK